MQQLPQSWILNWNSEVIFRGRTSISNITHKRAQYSVSTGCSAKSAQHSVLDLHWTCPSPTSPCLYLHASTYALVWVCNILWRYSSIEWAWSWVQAQHCKNKTTHTQQLSDAHKACPKSQLVIFPSLVLPYFALSLYITPALPGTATLCNRITSSTVLIYRGISVAWLFPAHRPSNAFVWMRLNNNSILNLLVFQLRWETLHSHWLFSRNYCLSPFLLPEHPENFPYYILNCSLPYDWRLPWQRRRKETHLSRLLLLG